MSKIILASKSPRRKEILSQVGIDFEVMVSDKEEIITKETPSDVVMELSCQKAIEVEKQVNYDEYIIIAADTVVALDNKILGKPVDREDAYNMIALIAGRKHSVYTGVTLIIKSHEKCEVKSFYEETLVDVYSMTEDKINRYLDMDEWNDKAGGYGIQESFAAYVKSIIGDYYTVVGLPISRIIYEIENIIEIT